jgi:hypothetical protein
MTARTGRGEKASVLSSSHVISGWSSFFAGIPEGAIRYLEETMLRNVSSLLGSTIRATDGDLGHVRDFLFDDRDWILRYLVVETGSWLSSRHVLISPGVAEHPDWEQRLIPVRLTKDQVRNAPDVDTAKPVSRQHEVAMSRYYGWPAYWPLEPSLIPVRAIDTESKTEEGDPHLRSLQEVLRYKALASDGELGIISDFIMQDAAWAIRFLVLTSGSWLGGRELLIRTDDAREISWANRQVIFTQPKAEL